MGKQFLLLLCLISAAFAGKGQSYYFENYQSNDGLPHNSITAIVQDRKGFMWIGTKGGLNRFDGVKFSNVLIPEERSGANSINVLHEDKKGSLWIGTSSGLFVLNNDLGRIDRANVPYSSIHQVREDHRGNLWMIADGKINRYNPLTKKYLNTGINASALATDENGVLWAGTGRGQLKRINVQGDKTWQTEIKIVEDSIILAQITCILPLKDQTLIGSRRGFFTYDLKRNHFRALLTRNPDGTDIYVRDMKVMADGKCWLATESGVFIYDFVKNTSFNLKKRAGDKYSLSDNAVYTLYQDNRNGIWAGTFFAGLNHLSRENNQFEKYFPINSLNSISGNAVREICADEDRNIWIGTEDAGINRFDPKTASFSHFSNGAGPSDLSYPNVHGLMVAGDKVFAGPFLRGLEVLNRNTGKVVERHPILQASGNVSNAFVMSIYKTAAKRILIGTTGAGLFYYEPLGKKLLPIPQIPRASYVFAIAEDHRGTIWTGSLANGTFFFNPKTRQQGNVSFRKNGDLLSRDDIIQGIFEDSKKNLWFSTEGAGLIKLSKDRRTFKRFTTKSGFPTNNIFRILEDDAQNLWISSLKGLICLNLNTERFHVYSQSNGLLTNQFNYNSAFKDWSGKMYFGSVKGMIAFHPDSLKTKTPAPPLYITSVHISNNLESHEATGLLEAAPMYHSDTLELNYDQSTFDVEFAALDYSAPSLIRYKYRMLGLNNDWTHIETNRKAYFTNLSPGNYKFVVQARSNIGLWESQERVLYIKISPPFWKSTTAYVCYAVIFCAILYTVISVYHRNLENKNRRRQQLFELEKEREVYQAKIEFFTNIAHEIQTPLTLIKGPIDWALARIEDIPTVQRNLELVKKNTTRLITLTSQLLDFRKTEQYQFKLNFVCADINKLLLDQIEAFSASFVEKDLNLTTTLPKRQVDAFIDPEACTKIISNLISNAIKYSEKNIHISLLGPGAENNVFKIRVENDGPLIPALHQEKIFEPFFRIKTQNNVQGTGIGLSLAKYLAELHQGNLMLVVHEEINIFELTLPVNQTMQFDLGPQTPEK